MRTVFIVNPKAGNGKEAQRLIEKIKHTSDQLEIKTDIIITQRVREAEAIATNIATECEKTCENVRIIACGGDGTLNEVLNGTMGCDKIAIGVMPIGTGNDFVRNFPKAGDFLSAEAQLKGEVTKCDAIRYEGLLEGKKQTRYCANMFNIGFDCNVVDMASKLKKYPLISGSFAYFLAVLVILIKKDGAKLKVEADGKLIENGDVLLTAIANGCYCGGGIKSTPEASVNDGIMDCNVIYNVSRLEFISKLPAYMKGTHPSLPGIERIICAVQCKKMVVTPLNGSMRLCTDGEICDAGRIEFESVRDAFNLVIPANL